MPGPVNPVRRRERLSSINDPNSLSAITARRSTPPVPAPAPKAPVSTRKCCDNPIISSDDGSKICYNCGVVLEESDIVAEVTFAENAAGAAVVQGGFVGENQRHANTMGGTMRGLGGMESREQTERNGTSEIAMLVNALVLGDIIKTQACNWYRLALNHNFVQGRRIRTVAAVAIYLAARKQPQNTVMLMDLAERIQVNVWALGDTYKKFCATIMEEDPAHLNPTTTLQEIEPLMLKYCRKLEFNNASPKVANDACKLLKRMKRDWMVQGRNPAGLCGACIVMAARMNNFRRTVREVVYVVKVADTTISQRLHEYKRTPSSALTVDQFREFGDRVKPMMQPPAVWKRAEKEQREEERMRKALESAGIVGEGLDDSNQTSENSSQAGSPSEQQKRVSNKPRATKRRPKKSPSQPQTSGDGGDQAMIDIEALGGGDSSLDALAHASAANEKDLDEEEVVVPKKRGRPPKKMAHPRPSLDDIEIEEAIQEEVEDVIDKWEPIFRTFPENENHPALVEAGETARQLAQQYKPNGVVSNEIELGEGEFEDDEDVRTCLLAPHEIRFKEKIWLKANEDWLRAQQAKMLAKALEEAQGKPKKPKQKRKHHQMGDGTLLGGQPAASAAEAAHKMLNKRAKHFSSHIDYEKLKELFPGSNAPATPSDTPEGSGVGASPAASVIEQQPSQASAKPQVENVPAEEEEAAGGDYEEEYPEDVEEFDDPNEYMSDLDEGFDENESYDY